MQFDKSKLKNTVLYGSLEKEEYALIQKDFIHMNQATLKSLTTITAAYMLFLLVLSLHSRIATANRPLYVLCLSATAIVAVVSWLGIFKTKTGTLTGVYFYLGTLFVYGIAIGCMQKAQSSVSFHVFIMVAPLIFYDRSLKMNIFILIFTLIFLCSSLMFKTPVAAETDLINGITYGTISCFINTKSMVMRTQRIWLRNRLQVAAEIDSLTGLHNRNSYERRSSDYTGKVRKSLSCIYIDANGLHKLNNSQGHAAGDKMLRYLAEQILSLFGPEDVYRMGGDEYMVFCCDADPALIRQKVDELSARMKEKHYSIAAGIVSVSADKLDMAELIKKADAQMYMMKKAYYAQKEEDRRLSETEASAAI